MNSSVAAVSAGYSILKVKNAPKRRATAISGVSTEDVTTRINHQLQVCGGVQLVSYAKTAHNKAKAPHLRSRT